MDGSLFYLPSVAELVYAAIYDTDFLGDLTDDLRLIEANAANSVDAAADAWSDAHHGASVPLSLIIAARAELVQQAHDLIADRAEAEWDAYRDARDAGDVDEDGCFISYDTYRSI